MPAQTILETLSRPVNAAHAVRMSLALVALGAGLAAAQAVSKPEAAPIRVATTTTLKPILLAVDWQEQSNARDGAVALAYAR